LHTGKPHVYWRKSVFQRRDILRGAKALEGYVVKNRDSEKLCDQVYRVNVGVSYWCDPLKIYIRCNIDFRMELMTLLSRAIVFQIRLRPDLQEHGVRVRAFFEYSRPSELINILVYSFGRGGLSTNHTSRRNIQLFTRASTVKQLRVLSNGAVFHLERRFPRMTILYDRTYFLSECWLDSGGTCSNAILS